MICLAQPTTAAVEDELYGSGFGLIGDQRFAF
jgi:hypothetical protein